MKALTVFALALCSLTAHAADVASVKVPMIDSHGNFMASPTNGLPKYETFTDANTSALCSSVEDKLTSGDLINSVLWYVSSPSDFEVSRGAGMCYTGDANAAMKIVMGLGGCALTEQFQPARRFVQNGVLHIQSASNDDGDDLSWSVVKKCPAGI